MAEENSYHKYITDAIWFQLKGLKAVQQGCFYQLEVEIKKSIRKMTEKFHTEEIKLFRIRCREENKQVEVKLGLDSSFRDYLLDIERPRLACILQVMPEGIGQQRYLLGG